MEKKRGVEKTRPKEYKQNRRKKWRKEWLRPKCFKNFYISSFGLVELTHGMCRNRF